MEHRRTEADRPEGTFGLGVRAARKLVVAVVGGTLIACGGLMLVLPGPGLVTIGGGLAVLAVEFTWARGLLRRAKSRAEALVGKRGPTQT